MTIGFYGGDSHKCVNYALTLDESILHEIIIVMLAEVPAAARVNIQPAEHLKNVSFSFYNFKPPRPRV